MPFVDHRMDCRNPNLLAVQAGWTRRGVIISYSMLVTPLYNSFLVQMCCKSRFPSVILFVSWGWVRMHVFESTQPLYVLTGGTVSTTAVAPTLWTDSFLPTAAIEPRLPDPQYPGAPVGFKEVFAHDSQVLRAAI